MNLLDIHKSGVLILAKAAPLVGAFAFIASIEATPVNESPWVSLWRIGLSAALGVFVALVGAIYHNLNERLSAMEKTQREDTITRREYEIRHQDIKEQLNRIEGQRRK